MKNNFGITFSERALEFLVDYFKIDTTDKTISQIKSDVFDLLTKYPIENCDDVLELFSQYSIYLSKWPFPGKMCESEYRSHIKKSLNMLKIQIL